MNKDDLICPLCNNKNACGANRIAPCWCMQKSVPKALLEQVPSKQLNKTCICANCIDQYNKAQQVT